MYPLLVDKEVVDEQGLSWCGTRLGETLVVAQHVDEARLAHVASSDECKFDFILLRTKVYLGSAESKF